MRELATPTHNTKSAPPLFINKMEADQRADSGFSDAELQGSTVEPVPASNQLDRALLKPRSTAAQLAVVEALSRQVQCVLSKQRAPPDEDNGYEFMAESAGISPSRSVLLTGLQLRASSTEESPPPVHSKRKTLLELARQSPGNSGYHSARASMSDKYRLSFVDVSGSSSEEETLPQPPIVWQDMQPLAICNQDRVGESVFRERNNERQKVVESQLLSVELDSLQGADLQYDDEGISLHKYTFVPTSISPHPLSHEPTYPASAVPNHTSPTPESSRVASGVQSKAPAVQRIDHTSFSPLYTMSILQLTHTVKLLEMKLQGIIYTTVRMCEELSNVWAVWPLPQTPPAL